MRLEQHQMSQLPGNPFAELIEPLAGQHAEVATTLALAYEQRTANLIALAQMEHRGSHGAGFDPDYDAANIYARMGIEE